MTEKTETPENLESTPKSRKIELIIGAAVLLVVAGIIVGLVLAFQNNTPKVVYQPNNACDVLTLAEAQELMGDNSIMSGGSDPVVEGNFGTSRCGYTNGVGDENGLIVAAISIRSAINDEGIAKNKTEFATSKPEFGMDFIADLGDEAYFNEGTGQLNILSGKDWMILSFGLGSSPPTNTREDAVKIGNKVIAAQS